MSHCKTFGTTLAAKPDLFLDPEKKLQKIFKKTLKFAFIEAFLSTRPGCIMQKERVYYTVVMGDLNTRTGGTNKNNNSLGKHTIGHTNKKKF